MPIRLIHDRWVSKYAEPWGALLSDLKRDWRSTMEKVFEIYIKTTPERLWQAIVDPEMRAKYNFGVGAFSDWTPGSTYEARSAKAPGQICSGENLEVDPPRKLVQSFRALWSDDVKAEGTSRVTWEIEPVQDSCRLTVDARQLARGCELRTLRRLADDSLGPENAARDRRIAHHARGPFGTPEKGQRGDMLHDAHDGVPAMFAFHDQDGDKLKMMEAS